MTRQATRLVVVAALAAVGVTCATPTATAGRSAEPPAARVATYGPSDAGRVLVLVPGLGGGGGNFAVVAPELVRRVRNLQVWVVDRRGESLEDHLGFAAGEPGTAYRYYFERLALGTSTFDPDLASKRPAARRWGLAVNLADLRAIVRRASAGGKRRVLLGGHSLGAATALAYAAWDFGGRAGHEDLSGLVLLDGGQLGTFGRPSLARVRQDLRRIESGSPFYDRLGIGVPWVFGVFGQLAAWYAAWAPDAPSALATSPLLPPSFRPEGAVTNLGFFTRSLGPAGIDAERCGVENALRMVGASNPNAFDWYFPARLAVDLLGASSLGPDPVTRHLGLRLRHLRTIDAPVYAFATGDIPTTLTGARTLLARSAVPRKASVLTSDPAMRHSDPLCTPFERSRFLQTLVPWLAKR